MKTDFCNKKEVQVYFHPQWNRMLFFFIHIHTIVYHSSFPHIIFNICLMHFEFVPNKVFCTAAMSLEWRQITHPFAMNTCTLFPICMLYIVSGCECALGSAALVNLMWVQDGIWDRIDIYVFYVSRKSNQYDYFVEKSCFPFRKSRIIIGENYLVHRGNSKV